MGAQPQVVGEYRLLAKLGEGGMGRVVRAEHARTGRPAAIKFLRREAAADEANRQRFLREGLVLKALDHPGLVRLLDWHLDDSEPYLVFELVEGKGLDEVVAQGPVELSLALVIAEEIARATGKLHAQGIVHRDLKPSNVMLRTDGTVCVLDLGLAKHFGADAHTIDRITEAGLTLGTIRYMAPEAILSPEKISSAADIWSLGVIFYELVAGRRPLADAEAQGVIKILEALRTGTFPTLSSLRDDLPRSIDPLVARLLDPDLARRIQSGDEAADAIGGFLATVADGAAARHKLQTFEMRAPARPVSGTNGAARTSGSQIAVDRKQSGATRSVAPPVTRKPASVPRRAGIAAAGVLVALIFAGFVSRRATPRDTAPSNPPPTVVAASPRKDAAMLAKLLEKERLNLDEAWLARFARARKSLIQTHPDAAAEELRAHLDRIGVGKALDRFLGRAGDFFLSAAIPEVERRAVRSALCDLELLEYFADEHKLPWAVVSPAGSIARCADSWDPPVHLANLPLRDAKSWIQWAVTPIRIGDIGRPTTTEWTGIPESDSGSWILWYSVEDWRPGLILDVRVSRRMRRLVRIPADRKATPLAVLAARYNGPHGVKENVQVEMFKSASPTSVLSYAAVRVPGSVIEPTMRAELRVIDLPLSHTRSRDPKLIDRVLTLLPRKQ